MSQNLSIKKILPRILKSFHKGLEESTVSIEDGDNAVFQEQPVTVQIAFTKTNPNGTEQLMTKESLTKMMRNDEEFNSFLKNDYQLNSTVVVKGVQESGQKNSKIYVSGSIPVNVRRTENGKKKHKEIHISGKLYKPESRRSINLRRSHSVMEERSTLRNTTLRKVELPLKELRSSLSGFTRRITDFEVVPWMSANYVPTKPSEVSSITILKNEQCPPSQGTLDTLTFPANSVHDKHMIAMPTNLEYSQFPSGDYIHKTDTEFCNPYSKIKNDRGPSNLSKEVTNESIDKSKFTVEPSSPENVPAKTVSGRKSYFESLKSETNSDNFKTYLQNENLMEKFLSGDGKKSFNDRISYFEVKALKKPEISEQTLDGHAYGKNPFKKMESFARSAYEKKIDLMNKPNDVENSKINNFVTVSNLTCEQPHCGNNVSNKLIPINENGKDFHEEVPVTSITITRSRTRIFKYDDGTGVEEKIGRQTYRVEAPHCSLYTCKTCLWPVRSNENVNIYNNHNENHYRDNELIDINNQSKIDKFHTDNTEVQNDVNNNSNNYSIYATQNIYQLNYPKEKEDKEYDFNDLIGDKYNPLTWLYNNYAKTKSLIKQFNHE